MNSKEIENGTLYLYKNDERLAHVIDVSGKCTLKKKRDYYHSFLRAIVGQQLSMFAARAIYKRFTDYFNGEPSPEQIIIAADEDLRKLGLSWAKAKYIKDLSAKIIAGEVHFNNLARRSNEDIITEFTKVKGVGVWSVQMFLIFTLCRPDVLPLNDLGIRKGIMKVYNLKKLPDEKKILAISKKNKWAPYNSIASWYIWRSLEVEL